MKAVLLNEYGGPEQLVIGDAPQPTPGAGQVLVRILATSLNPVDLKRASGKMREVFPVKFPFIPGGDFSGTIESLGDGVKTFHVGDEVFGYSMTGGAYAEYIVMGVDEVATKPKQVTDVEAASLAIVGQTAMQMVENANLTAGQTVLILGAGGAVGSILVQLAHARGAKIIAVAYAESAERLSKNGADVVIDAATTPLETAANQVDVVFDCLGGELQQRSFPTLKRGGVLLSITMPPSAEEAAKYGVRAEMLFTKSSAENLQKLAEKVDGGEIKPFVGRTYPLDQVSEVWALSRSEHIEGKVVFTVPLGV